jgi:threonine dehydratase
MPEIALQDVYLARRRIASLAVHSPLISSPPLSALVAGRVYLKAEIYQRTGSFKIRGAANMILSLPEGEKARGVITASTGNHGRAVAYVARGCGVQATVCISDGVPQDKVEALRELGAEVVIHGRSQDDAFEKAGQLREQHGYTMVPPFDDAAIIAGQGTIGLEIMEDLPEVGVVLVPVSGGGLVSGIAKTIKSMNASIRVIGASMGRSPVMYQSLKAGKPVQMEEAESLADSLQGGIGLDNQFTFSMVQKYVDDLVLVSEADIAAAMRFAFEHHHMVLEGAGAVGIAALMQKKVNPGDEDIVVVLSGGNVSVNAFLETLKRFRRET